jgi:hypothetical protein
MLMINAIEHEQSSSPDLVPGLRACIHIGSHYEFYQPDALSPTTFSYMVGEVTIELARMIEHAMPGQILVGDFRTPMYDYDSGDVEFIDSVNFINRTRRSLAQLNGMKLANTEIDEIKCYLTGIQHGDGNFDITQYAVSDKHDLEHNVYNAKRCIYRDNGGPIYLGVQEHAIDCMKLCETVNTTL